MHERGRTTRWLKVRQKAWTVEEGGWRRRISSGNSEGWHLVVNGDDEKIRNLLLGTHELVDLDSSAEAVWVW